MGIDELLRQAQLPPAAYNRCEGCGNLFIPLKITQKFCNEECRDLHYKDYARQRDAGRPRNYGGHHQRDRAINRPFVAWDGEGEDGKYTLLANSRGQELRNRDGLSTEKCLDFLLNHTGYNQTNIWFSFGYDVAMILRDIPLENREKRGASLRRLHETTKVTWRGYTIHYIPRKTFSVSSYKHGYQQRFHSYDAFGFFQKGFVKTCKEWLGYVPDVITEGKAAREAFRDWDLDKIADYNREECKLLSAVMDKFRNSVLSAGMTLKAWHGPGAIAGEWLKANNIGEHIAAVPDAMQDAVLRAYFGGRIELAAWGRAAPVYHYDINSAYPSALREVRSLSGLDWHLESGGCEADFALAHVRWDIPHGKDPFLWGPFPYRDKSNKILFPMRGEGWYWNVEVKSALRRLGDEHIVVMETWMPQGEEIYPFAEAIERDAARRLELKALSDPANVPLKLALNSLYGKLAQKIGFFDKDGNYSPPRFQCYPWAGFVTAHCRAKLQDAIGMAGGRVACVMTDSVWSLVELPGLKIGKGLGEWEYQDEDVAADFCGAGLYQSYDADGNIRPSEYKSRGFSSEQMDNIDYAAMVERWEHGLLHTEIIEDYVTSSRRFVGLGLALATHQYKDRFCQFVDIEKRIENLSLLGHSKRMGYLESGMMDPAMGMHFMVPAAAGAEIVGGKGRGRNAGKGQVMLDFGGIGEWVLPCSYPYRAGAVEREMRDESRIEYAAREDEDG